MKIMVVVTFRLLAGDSLIPHVPPLMGVPKGPHTAGAISSTTSAPSKHDAPLALDLRAMSLFTSVATRHGMACAHSLMGKRKKCQKHASAKHRQECLPFIVEIAKAGETQ